MADKKNKPPFYLIDTNSAFYKPFATRLVICIAVVIWAGLETWHRDPFWSVISIACAAYCAYVLFWTYKPPIEAPPRPLDVDDDEQNQVTEAAAAPDADTSADDKPKA